jgi:hypothetical protein
LRQETLYNNKACIAESCIPQFVVQFASRRASRFLLAIRVNLGLSIDSSGDILRHPLLSLGPFHIIKRRGPVTASQCRSNSETSSPHPSPWNLSPVLLLVEEQAEQSGQFSGALNSSLQSSFLPFLPCPDFYAYKNAQGRALVVTDG